jgi:hypothetical protein
MKSIIYFLFILFLETTCGLILYILYYMVSKLVFNHDGLATIYYIVIILPPSIFCFMEYRRLTKAGDQRFPNIYLTAAITYFITGSLCLLFLV